MPPFSVGFTQVEQRLGIVRRRLNSVTVQDAVYLGGSLIALAAALVIAVAVRGRATLFAVAVWAAVAAVAAAIGAAIWRIRRRWLSVEQVIRFADHRASLDDRLATLLLDPSRARASRLRDILLEQILAASPAWDVDMLAPRRVPRSAYALLGAIGALVLTSFLVRPPARPRPANEAMRPKPASVQQPDAMLQPHPGAAMAGARGTAPGAGAQAGAAGGAEHSRAGAIAQAEQAAGGATTGGAARTNAQPKSRDAKQGAARGGESRASGDRQAPADADTRPKSADASQGMTEKLQDTIRQALGAPRPDAGERKHGRAERPDEQGRQPEPSERKPPNQLADKSAGDRKASLQQPGTGESMPGRGSAAHPGARIGSTAGELLAKEGKPRMAKGESGTMTVKLGAFSAMQPSQLEPQRQPPVEAVPHGGAPASAPPPLSEEQIPDAPLQKTDVAPEHEAVVRRIYTRE